jgi:flagellar basal body-associated protein FliL
MITITIIIIIIIIIIIMITMMMITMMFVDSGDDRDERNGKKIRLKKN